MGSPKMSLKLLVDRKGDRVLFAEAPKEFVDFLFHILSLPLGTLIEFVGPDQMVGSLGKLNDTIKSFNENYLQPGIKKHDIFNPKTPFNGNNFLLSYDAYSEDHASFDDKSGPSKAYRCLNATRRYISADCGCQNNMACKENVSLQPSSKCPGCNGFTNVPIPVVMPKEVLETKEPVKKNNAGYVNEVVTYMVMDDLVVKPMSTLSSITLINKFGVKNLSQLEEKTVSFGKDEGLKLLIASLKTDKVLTTIFMS